MRWVDYIVQALENLDGEAKYQDIYEEVRKLKEKDRIKLPTHWKAIIRGRIENHCEEVDGYIEGHPSLFYPPEGKGKGVWALSNDALSILNKRYKEASYLGLIIAYYLSKFNEIAYQKLGFANQKETHVEITRIIGMKRYTSLKNMRDTFDPLHDNRLGWWQKPLPKRCRKIVELYDDLSEEEYYDYITLILEEKKKEESEVIAELVSPLEKDSNKKGRRKPKLVLRGKTGAFAENYFKKNFRKFFKGNLIDTTKDQCGYDYKITNNNSEIFIEVKGMNISTDTISLTSKEWSVAKKSQESYYIAIVKNVGSNGDEEICLINNPATKLNPKKYVYTIRQIQLSVSKKDLDNALSMI